MIRFLAAFFMITGAVLSDTGTSVSWSIGTASSTVDGVADAGPVTFTWTFDRSVTYGYYVDGTPWVIWENGLKLVSVSPAKQVIDVPDVGSNTATGCTVDATCINMTENRMPLDQRMGGTATTGAPWSDGADVWDGTPALLYVGDCIATGRGRRNSRAVFRKMVFTAVGVCNIVAADMTGYYRPPIRMPAYLRAQLSMPRQVDVTTLPSFNVPEPKLWNGSATTLDFSMPTTTYKQPDADDLCNGPQTVCGIYSYVWYEPGSAMLNHNLNGTEDGAYQRDVSDRFATCLYAAFDPDGAVDRRQRNLDKFIQVGLDYFYQYCLGYAVWNGGGGHCNGIEGVITITGALLGDSTITNAMKYQRFPGYVVGRGDTVTDMRWPGSGFARTEALYLVAPAAWRSGESQFRTPGTGASSLDECFVRFDMADPDHVINNADVPYTAMTDIDSCTAITIDPSYVWPMWSRNIATEARRSFRYIVGGVVRLNGDAKIRKILDFKQDASTSWGESSWNDVAKGTGGLLFVYPALTAAEKTALGQSGTLTTGLCSRQEVEGDRIALWESWAADNAAVVQKSFFVTPTQDYLDNKVGDNFHWLPYYHILDDPGAPGKKMYEENTGSIMLTKFIRMQRDFGSACWSQFIGGSNLPKTPIIQALIRYYVLNDTMSAAYCKTYDADDNMWNEETGILDFPDRDRGSSRTCAGLVSRSDFLQTYPEALLFTLDGQPVHGGSPATGMYFVKFNRDEEAQAIILCD